MDVLRQLISSPSATGAATCSACVLVDVLAGMTNFLTRTQGLDEQVARGAAVEMMAKQPAWRKV